MYKNDQKNDPKVPKKTQKKPYYHGPTPPPVVVVFRGAQEDVASTPATTHGRGRPPGHRQPEPSVPPEPLT